MPQEKLPMNQPDPTRTDGAAQQPVSDCCHARVHIEGGKEGTQWAVCDKCGEPCDVVDPSAAAPVSATVEQRHEDICEGVGNILFSKLSSPGENVIRKAAQLLADFEARVVAEATAELRIAVGDLL